MCVCVLSIFLFFFFFLVVYYTPFVLSVFLRFPRLSAVLFFSVFGFFCWLFFFKKKNKKEKTAQNHSRSSLKKFENFVRAKETGYYYYLLACLLFSIRLRTIYTIHPHMLLVSHCFFFSCVPYTVLNSVCFIRFCLNLHVLALHSRLAFSLNKGFFFDW